MTDLLRPIAGIENRTPQEVFDIMCARINAEEPCKWFVLSRAKRGSKVVYACATCLRSGHTKVCPGRTALEAEKTTHQEPEHER